MWNGTGVVFHRKQPNGTFLNFYVDFYQSIKSISLDFPELVKRVSFLLMVIRPFRRCFPMKRHCNKKTQNCEQQKAHPNKSEITVQKNHKYLKNKE